MLSYSIERSKLLLVSAFGFPWTKRGDKKLKGKHASDDRLPLILTGTDAADALAASQRTKYPPDSLLGALSPEPVKHELSLGKKALSSSFGLQASPSLESVKTPHKRENRSHRAARILSANSDSDSGSPSTARGHILSPAASFAPLSNIPPPDPNAVQSLNPTAIPATKPKDPRRHLESTSSVKRKPLPSTSRAAEKEPLTSTFEVVEIMARARPARRRATRESSDDADDELVPARRSPVRTRAVSRRLRDSEGQVNYPDLKPALKRQKDSSLGIQQNRSQYHSSTSHSKSNKIDKRTVSKQSETDLKPSARLQRFQDREQRRNAANKSSAPQLLNGGTRNDPVVLGSDREDSDVEMYYEASPDLPSVYRKPAVTQDCAVCGDEIHKADMPSLSTCTHQPEVCPACFAQWIASELEGKGWKGITCPTTNCNVILEHHEVQLYATQDVFTQYDTFAMRDALGQVPNFRWCRRRGCGSGQIHDEDGYIFTCAACGHKTCTVHDVDWHDGETCEEYTYRASGQRERDLKAQEDASIETIKTLSKKCPGVNCAFNIQKNAGCDHMTCSRCRHEFCWVCLADYNNIRTLGNTAHGEDCTYHSSRIR